MYNSVTLLWFRLYMLNAGLTPQTHSTDLLHGGSFQSLQMERAVVQYVNILDMMSSSREIVMISHSSRLVFFRNIVGYSSFFSTLLT